MKRKIIPIDPIDRAASILGLVIIFGAILYISADFFFPWNWGIFVFGILYLFLNYYFQLEESAHENKYSIMIKSMGELKKFLEQEKNINEMEQTVTK
jgi:hypothetical protein